MKALCVFSGGLDSMLASAIVRGLGIEVQALFFETPFFTAEKAKESAETLNLPIKIIDITDTHLKIVKKPKHGYGENMNPCIDCHALMIRTAGEMLERENASFIITGEVLGQRPMSQNRRALSIVDKESGMEGLILRPLSAKHLSPTIPEEKQWIERHKLMDFSGRSRKPQMELAKNLNITRYPSPAGGCLLTDPVFSRRLRDLFSSGSGFERRDIELLKFGRHFRIGPETKVIVGRNKAENDAIQLLSGMDDLLVYTISVPGPTVLVTGRIPPGSEELAAAMTLSYSDAGDGKTEEVSVMKGGERKRLWTEGPDKKAFRRYMI